MAVLADVLAEFSVGPTAAQWGLLRTPLELSPLTQRSGLAVPCSGRVLCAHRMLTDSSGLLRRAQVSSDPLTDRSAWLMLAQAYPPRSAPPAVARSAEARLRACCSGGPVFTEPSSAVVSGVNGPFCRSAPAVTNRTCLDGLTLSLSHDERDRAMKR
ncbi:hypothetical protein LZ30DRAFT_693887 [Colletotrichum cereale]|nr:hypothetical protein LZ30DRAFT_693887 [Colletotrichum cereale]